MNNFWSMKIDQKCYSTLILIDELQGLYLLKVTIENNNTHD